MLLAAFRVQGPEIDRGTDVDVMQSCWHCLRLDLRLPSSEAEGAEFVGRRRQKLAWQELVRWSEHESAKEEGIAVAQGKRLEWGSEEQLAKGRVDLWRRG